MKNIKLSYKLIGGFVLTALITLAVGLQDRMGMNTLEGDLKSLAAEEMVAVEDSLQVGIQLQRIRSSMNLLMGQVIGVKERTEIAERVVQRQSEAEELLARLKAQEGLGAEILAAVEELERSMGVWDAAIDGILGISGELSAMDVPNPDALAAKLHRLSTTHHELMNRVAGLALYGKSFAGGEHAKTCPLGLWLQEYATTNPEIAESIERLKPLHEELHQSVVEVKEYASYGDLLEARRVYEGRCIPAAEKVFMIFKELLFISGEAESKFKKMEKLFVSEEAPARVAVQKNIDGLMELVQASSRAHLVQAGQIADSVKMRSAVMVGLGALLGLAIGIVLTRTITGPLFKGVALARAMAEGDLTRTMDVSRKDEIGVLASALNEMVLRLRDMLGEVAGEVASVSMASQSLAGVSEQMAGGATVTVQRAQQVTVAAEEMSANQNSVAAAMEQAATNINTVAAAAEEMSATIGEIAANSARAKSITGEAVSRAGQASSRVQDLGTAAQEIGKVTESITAISSQTNLLALNATIEAARAGEAGRGFAVVANEIKELALQTAQATEEIRGRIQGIQDATGQTVTEIDGISGVIADVDDIVGTIAAAVEEQTSTTREIAASVGQASQGIAEVNTNVAQSSTVAGTIASDISDVSVQANDLLASGEQVRQSASGLSETAAKLKNLVSRFTLNA